MRQDSEWQDTTPDLTRLPLVSIDDIDLALRERTIQRVTTALAALLIAAVLLRLFLSF